MGRTNISYPTHGPIPKSNLRVIRIEIWADDPEIGAEGIDEEQDLRASPNDVPVPGNRLLLLDGRPVDPCRDILVLDFGPLG
jgi:hypothetical protein